MDNKELRTALEEGFQVECEGVRYDHVDQIVYRRVKGKISVTAGLMDLNGNCLVFTVPAKIKRADG